MYIARSHRARALFGSSSSSAHPGTSTSHKPATSTIVLPPVGNPDIGGDIGSSPTDPVSPNVGGNTTPTTTSPVPLAPPITTSPPTINPDPIPPPTVTQNPGGVGRVPNGHSGNGDGTIVYTSTTGGSVLPNWQSSSIQVSGTVTVVWVPLSTSTAGVVRGTQTSNSEANVPSITPGYSIPQTLSTDVTPTANSDSPGQTQTNNSVTPNAKSLHHGLPSGAIAGIAIFIAICLLVIIIFFVRGRKEAQSSGHEDISNEAQDVTNELPPQGYESEERTIVTEPPHNPPDGEYCYNPTPVAHRSSSRLLDSDPFASALSPLQMVEIDGGPRPLPTLVFDTSRYRRNNSRLSLATTKSGDSYHPPGAQRQSPLENNSFIPPRLLTPSVNSLRRLSSNHQDSGSPQSSSPTNMRAPQSPRSPTRSIPPIPPLPRSPPPIPGVYANPFVDRNPFDDPTG